MCADELNQRLLNLYAQAMPLLRETIQSHADSEQLLHMHGPFMMYVHPAYAEARIKLMVVGMETYGWEPFRLDEDHNITYQRTTQVYQAFTSDSTNYSSPFWWFIRDLCHNYGEIDYMKAVLWTNLSKIDIARKRPSGAVYDNTMPGFLSLLAQEVAIVKPDILLIATTSPNYQWHLQKRFKSTEGSSEREVLIPKLLFRWITDELPANTFQLCHPNRLRFVAGGYKRNAEQIIRTIEQQAR